MKRYKRLKWYKTKIRIETPSYDLFLYREAWTLKLKEENKLLVAERDQFKEPKEIEAWCRTWKNSSPRETS